MKQGIKLIEGVFSITQNIIEYLFLCLKKISLKIK